MAFVPTGSSSFSSNLYANIVAGNLLPESQIVAAGPTLTTNKKVVDPFDPEATVPMPFQLDDHFGTVWKRNERERYRVRCVNEGFDNLRRHLPLADGEKRISKVDTLRLAIRYIRHLDAVLKSDQHIYRCRCFHGFQEESEGNVQVVISSKHS